MVGAVLADLLLPRDRRFEGGDVVEQRVVRQQPEFDERALRAAPPHVAHQPRDPGSLGAQRPADRVLRGVRFEQRVDGLVDAVQPVLQVGAAGLPPLLDAADGVLQPGGGERAQVGGGVRRHRVAEQVEERLDGAALQCGGGERGEPARLAEQRGRAARQRQHAGQPAAGAQVDQVRGVLAAQDLDGGQVAAGRHDPARDHRLGLVDEVQVAGVPADERHQERVAGLAPGPPDPLDVVGGAGRQRREDHRGQVADVDAEFQRRRARHHVGVVVALLLLAEPRLDVLALPAGERAGVLGRHHPERLLPEVQAAVVVVAVAAGAAVGEGSAAPVAGARLPVPGVHQFGAEGLLPRAPVAAEPGVVGFGVGQGVHEDVPRLQPVHPGGSVDDALGDEALFGEDGQEPPQVFAGLPPVEGEAAGGPVLRPALVGVDPVELRPPLLPVEQERRGAQPAGERGHPVGPPAPDRAEPAAAAVRDPRVQPPVLDRAPVAEPFQQPPHERRVPLRGLRLDHAGDLRVDVPRERRDPAGVGQRDLGDGGAGEVEGASLPGPQPELQDRLERQPLPDQLPRGGGAAGGLGEDRVHFGAFVQVRRDDRGQHPGLAGRRGEVPDHLVQRRALPRLQPRVDQPPQRERVGAVRHEPGPVRRVLHGVVEQQRLAAARVGGQLPARHQLGDRHRRQRRQPRAEVPDALVHRARRAPVLHRGVLGRLVVRDVGEDEHAVVERAVPVPRRVERLHPVPGEDGEAAYPRLDLRLRRRDERADALLLRPGGRPVDPLGDGDEVAGVALRGERRPPGPPAVPAVDGREHRPVVGVEAGLGLQDRRLPDPRERGPVVHHPQQPRHRPHPQMRLHQQEWCLRVVGLGVARRGDQRHEPRQRLRRLGRVVADGRAPPVRAHLRQQLQHLLGCERVAVLEQFQDGAGEDVPLQRLRELSRRQVGAAGDLALDAGQRARVVDRVAARDEVVRGRQREVVVEGVEELVDGAAVLPDHGVFGEGRPEHFPRRRPDLRAVAALAQRRGRRDGADVPQRPARLGLAGDGREPAQQHRHVGALRAVVGVELVHHHVTEIRVLPQRHVVAALEEQVQHLVVRDQDVGRVPADLRPVRHDPRVADLRGVPDVEARGDLLQPGLVQVVVEPVRLVGGERVHGVQQDGLGAAAPLRPLPPAVVQHGDQERLGLTGPGSRRDQRRLRRAVEGTEPLERLRLVAVGTEAELVPLKAVLPAGLGFPERRPDAQVGAAEDALHRVIEEPLQRLPRRRVAERERRRQVLGQVLPQLLRRQRRLQVSAPPKSPAGTQCRALRTEKTGSTARLYWVHTTLCRRGGHPSSLGQERVRREQARMASR